MTSLATIDPQWFLLDVFLFGIVAVIAAIYVYKVISKEKLASELPFEKISTEGFSIIEFVSVGFVVLLFSTSIWLPLVVDTSKTATPTESNSLTYLINILLLLSVQFFIPCIVLLTLLSNKVNLLDALGLRNIDWGKASFFVLLGTVAAYVCLLLLGAFGYEEWLTSWFGPMEEQAAVKALKNADSAVKKGMMIVTAVIVAPICEEVIFRSFLYTATKKYTGAVFAALSSALLFSVVHGNVRALVPLFCVGLILALAYELSGSLWTNITIHAIFNLISVAVMLNM